jgi:hypothetical protein
VPTKFTIVVASLALALAASAQAQSPAGSPGQAQQGDATLSRQPQQPAGPPSQGQQSPKQQIEQQHKAAIQKCNALKENAKDICKAEADGQQKVAEAQAKVTERDTPKNRLDLDKAKAEAEYKVAKERCDDQVGDAKRACTKQAKAARDSAVAQAEKDSQKTQ